MKRIFFGIISIFALIVFTGTLFSVSEASSLGKPDQCICADIAELNIPCTNCILSDINYRFFQDKETNSYSQYKTSNKSVLNTNEIPEVVSSCTIFHSENNDKNLKYIL
jgi:hypothetical protein